MRYIGENEVDSIPDPEAWVEENQRPEVSGEGIDEIMRWAVALNEEIGRLRDDHTPKGTAKKEVLAASREAIVHTLICVFPSDIAEGTRSELPDYWKIRFQAGLRARAKELGSTALGK